MNYSEPLLCNRYYHLYNHAVGNDNLFVERQNYLYFLTKYSEYISPVCGTYAYSLMPNHFHFLINVKPEKEIILFNLKKRGKEETLDSIDLSKVVIQQFSNFFNCYAKSFNKKYGRKGSLFIDYVRRKEIKEDSYFFRLIFYIHNNPVHHGFCKNIGEWEFTSYDSILSGKASKLEKEQSLKWFGDRNEFLRFHRISPKLWKAKEMDELEFL